MTRQALWLLGHGIADSPSPAMQNAALRACELDWEYVLRDVAPSSLGTALAEMRAGGARGANVTIPHKRAVAAACDELVGDAAVTRAVNTVVVEEGRLVGDNTDAPGLEGALRHLDLWPAPGAAVVVLGAGGAAAAAVLALSRAAAAAITVAARRRDAADAVIAALGAHVPVLRAADWNPGVVRDRLRHGGGVSVLVNATPAPLAELPVDISALPQTCVMVDLRYRPRPVDLVAAASQRGLRASDGLEMLLHQGMLSFERWTGMPPPWEVARAALREAAGVP